MTTHDEQTHDELRSMLPELALGVLDGRDRARLLAHLDTCPECNDDATTLTATVDALLLVPANAEPPVGFESSVITRIRQMTPARRRGRRARTALVAAAVLVVAGFGLGWALHRSPATSGAGRLEQRALESDGRSVGIVYAYSSSPAWMFVSVDAPGAPAVVRCVLVKSDGSQSDIGNFRLNGGSGAWAASLPIALGSVRNIELTSTSGVVVASLRSTSWSSSAGSWPN